jgi:anaerobic selenocysteine-containing dehydrogenase
VAQLAAEGGMRALRVSPVAHPGLRFPTPSGKVEFCSSRAEALGLPALPVHRERRPSPYPLTLCQGRTLSQFHGFYDHGRALPTLARLDPEPEIWLAPADAARRGIAQAGRVRVWNERGALLARARVTDRVPEGTVWMRDGWTELNTLTSGAASLPDRAVDLFGFAAGQATFEAMVEVTLVA